MNDLFVPVPAVTKSQNFFIIENKFNRNEQIRNIATACEKQCIHCNVNSQKLGRTRS